MSAKYWQVAVNAPLPKPLTYLSDSNQPDPKRGQAVIVPLAGRKAQGVVLGPTTTIDAHIQFKKIEKLHEELPQLPEAYVEWIQWLSDYYLHPIGQVFHQAFPTLSKHSKRKSQRPPIVLEGKPTSPPPLTEEQRCCIDGISVGGGFSRHLIFGVTGSGKTEIYLQLLEQTIKAGKQGLVLVPEISLTPQLVQRFASRFGPRIAVIHSHLTEREWTDQWWSMVDEKTDILIGARSALFCPLKRLGLIVIDEEHEPSFKQEEKLKYHARDAAVILAQKMNCPIVLGSATPSLESWNNAKSGKYILHTLKNRVADRPMPQVEVIDLREVKKEETNLPFWLSPSLYQKLETRLIHRQQSVLFLNRRGSAQVVLCPGCGWTNQCPNCAVTLTLHGRSYLVCHYCNFHENFRVLCSKCHQCEVKPLGVGTELLEENLKTLFPRARIERADRDQIESRQDLETLIEGMENREIDILVGTQMIAKGLDFEHLTLVGVVLADVGFNLPDFRSSERSFQLLMQVAGRAGRHQVAGEVVIQTYNPGHVSIFHSRTHDYSGFADKELEFRKELNYPPFGKLASVRIQGANLKKVQQASQELLNLAETLKKKVHEFTSVQILGPAEAPLARLRGKHRYHLLLKCPKPPVLTVFCQKLHEFTFSGVKISIDIDPLQMM